MATKIPKLNIQFGGKVSLENLIEDAVNNVNFELSKGNEGNHGGLPDPKTLAKGSGQGTTEEVFFDIESNIEAAQNENNNVSSQPIEKNINQGNSIEQNGISKEDFGLNGQPTNISNNSYTNNEQTTIDKQSISSDISNPTVANEVKEAVENEEDARAKSGDELQTGMAGTVQSGSKGGLNTSLNIDNININNATGNAKQEKGVKGKDITINTPVSGENQTIEDNHDIASIYGDDEYEQILSEYIEVLNEQLQFYKDALGEVEKRELEVKKAIAEMTGMTYEDALAENKTNIYEESYGFKSSF